MGDKKVIVPTKDEVKRLFEIIVSDQGIHMNTVSEVLGMKWVDSLFPKIEGEPDWGYEGLVEFCNAHNIILEDSLIAALEKLEKTI